MRTVIPLQLLLGTDEFQVSIVHQGRSLQRLARILLSHLGGRQFAQFVVDERQEFIRGALITGLDPGKDVSDVGHTGSIPKPARGSGLK